MRFDRAERYRILAGDMATKAGVSEGAFKIPYEVAIRRSHADGGTELLCSILFVIAHKATNEEVMVDGVPIRDEWDHVSVSLRDRCPAWGEMAFVKRVFWDDDEAVMQLHVPKSQHVNVHPFCLHLWRPTRERIPLPPKELV